MSPIVSGLVGISLLLIILAIGVPVGSALIGVGFAGLWFVVSQGAAMAKLAATPFTTISSYDLAVLPLFLFMAQIVFTTGLTKDLYNLASKWLGRLPGGIAMATIAACAMFAACSSSAIATALTIGLVALPEMNRYQYDPKLAMGVIAVGGSLGVLIPPSSVLILYGLMTETSIGKLFIAGLIPGILAAILYMITISILCLYNPKLGPRGPSYNLKEKMVAIANCSEILVLLVFVLGGLLVGWFTPSEAGAVGAFGAIVLSLIRKRLKWGVLKQALLDCMKTTGIVYFILIGAFIFQYFMSVSTIPQYLADLLGTLNVNPMLIMALIIFMYIILGTFMDEMTMMLATLPILFPMIVRLGFDPVWFGIILTRMIMIAGYSPPTGLVLFTLPGIAPDIPITTIYKSVIPFFITDVIHVILLVIFPSIVLFLPKL